MYRNFHTDTKSYYSDKPTECDDRIRSCVPGSSSKKDVCFICQKKKTIYKRVQHEGLSQLCMNDDVFRNNIRMISALSFLPIADTIQAFDAQCNHAGNVEQVILDHFETNYIGELRRGRRLPPRFPHVMWNMNVVEFHTI